VALRLCVPRRPSASNPSSPRSTANTIPSYTPAASLSSLGLRVGSVVPPHANWPGEKNLCSFTSFRSRFPSHPHFLCAFPRISLFVFYVPGRGRCMHVMRCATERSHGASSLVVWAPPSSPVSLSIPIVPHPRSLWTKLNRAVLTRDSWWFVQARAESSNR
jgi:hypothetical protein